jgi:hypothetical protein
MKYECVLYDPDYVGVAEASIDRRGHVNYSDTDKRIPLKRMDMTSRESSSSRHLDTIIDAEV